VVSGNAIGIGVHCAPHEYDGSNTASPDARRAVTAAIGAPVPLAFKVKMPGDTGGMRISAVAAPIVNMCRPTGKSGGT